MLTWGIVLLVIGYLGIGMATNRRMCDNETHSTEGYLVVVVIWPLIVIPQIVLWATKQIHKMFHREKK